jgi:predicted phosphodiesterase
VPFVVNTFFGLIRYYKFMRLAVLADVHGNIQALEAVLEHAQKQKIDNVIIAGDLVNLLPDSRACWELVQSLKLPMVRGNHERYVFHYDTPFADPFWHSEAFKVLGLTVAQFSEAERQQMEGLPLRLHFDDLLVVHASYRGDYDSIFADTPETELASLFAGSIERFILRGHNHHSYVVQFRGRHIETISSAGLPLDGTPEAKYVIAEKLAQGWRIERQEVAYDHQAAVKRLESSIFIEQGGPVAKIFLRELLTSRYHVVRFWKEYKKWSQNETLTLEQAVDNFLAHQD